MTVHSFSTQNSSDNLPSYLQTNIKAQMLSIGGTRQGGICSGGRGRAASIFPVTGPPLPPH